MVECFLAKEDVAGSNPVSRSKTHRNALSNIAVQHAPFGRLSKLHEQGAVPKW